MRGELNLIRFEMELFEQFAGVAMAEDGVDGEVVGRVHEVSVCGRGFSGSADSGFCVADDAVGNIHETSLKQWREREDDGGSVAAGVGDEARVGDLVTVEFGTSVDCLGLKDGRVLGVCVVQVVDGAVGALLEAPGSAEVDDLDAVLDGLGYPLAGLLVWGREEENFAA